MKPKDFMIGDILMAHLDDGEQKVDFPVVIDGLDENGTLVEGDSYFSWMPLYKEHNHLEYADELEPIPLTTEILEKNGFEYDEEDGWEFVGKDYEPVISCVLEKCFVQIDSGGLEAEFRVQYVHELQRALRCCGLWDLAENFKI